MRGADRKTADSFVEGEKTIPHPVNGPVPLYEDHPPDTILPTWRCPHCGGIGVTLKDLWKLYMRRERLFREREEYDYPSEEWKSYQDGIRETNQQIGYLSGCLPSNLSKWARSHADPDKWENSILNPENRQSVEPERDRHE
jgi:hypothetical protein